MATVVERIEDLSLDPARSLSGHVRAETFDLCLRFDSSVSCSRYLRALVSLLFGTSTKVAAVFRTGTVRDDLTAEEIAERLVHGAINEVRFELRIGERSLPIDVAALALSENDVAPARHLRKRPGQLQSMVAVRR